MGNVYDGAFRTILNDCRKLIIPIMFDKQTIIDLSSDVINEIAQKYKNVKKGRKRSGGPLYCADRSGA